jgi:hypothetical protein
MALPLPNVTVSSAGIALTVSSPLPSTKSTPAAPMIVAVPAPPVSVSPAPA